ncbi:MAG: hypothetical protein JKY60_14550 [Kordiimonadaceae bacterium]|nr:hypothetical protein [Kordiimonadaceae bacterium]
MVRISSFGQQQLLIRAIQDNQRALFEDQRQISTGKKADNFQGLAGQTNTVLGSRSFLSRVETYQETISTVRGKLDANDVQIGGIIKSVETLRDTIRTSIANSQAEGLSEQLKLTFEFTSNALNTNFGGSFLFSGAGADVTPVNVTDLAGLAALPAISDAFDNAAQPFVAKIADGVDTEFGLLADDIGSAVFTELRNLYNLDQGVNGPFDGPLNPTQFALLQTQLVNLETALDGLRAVQTKNGLAFERLEVVDEQHADTSVFLQTFIADIEDVNLAEAISSLNSNQLALEASFRSIGSLTQLSLLNFL